MKILFKHITNEFQNKRIEFKEASELVFTVLDQAFMSSIIVWHAGKDIAFDEELLDYINFDKLTINWGGYGSRISLEKLYEYFNFQYPGDEVINGKLKSKVTNRKDSLKLVKAYFENEINKEIKDQFIALGGIESTLKDDETFLWVSKEKLSTEQKSEAIKKAELEGGISYRRFIFLTEENIAFLFPAKVVRTKTVPRDKKVVPKSIEQKSLSQLQKLLTSRAIDEINQGVTLIEGLNDPEIFKYFLEGIVISKEENGFNKIIPNKYFDDPKIAMPYYNYSMLSLILCSKDIYKESALMLNQLDSLSIDLADFSILEKLTHLKNLQLSCSSNNIKEFPIYESFQKLEVLDVGSNMELINVENISKLTSLKKLIITNKKEINNFNSIECLTQLEYLDISHCEKIESIDFVANMNQLTYFDFSYCKNVKIMSALSGKKLTNKYLNIKENRMQDLTGIIAYQELETLAMCETNDNIDINKYKELTSLPNLKSLYNYKSKAMYQGAGEMTPANTELSLYIHYPLNKYEIKNDSYEMKFNLKGVDQFEAIGEKTFCKILKLTFKSLRSLDFLKNFKVLENLELIRTNNDVTKLSNLDFSVLKEIKSLKNLSLRNINIEHFEFLKELPQIENLSFDDLATLTSLEGVQHLSNIQSYSGLYISTYNSEFKEEVIFNSCREIYYQTNNKPESKPNILAESLRPIAENTNIADNIYELNLRHFKKINDFGDPAAYPNLVKLSLDSKFNDTFSNITNWNEFPSLKQITIASNIHLKFSENSDKINILIRSSLAEMKDVNISGKGVGAIYIAMHQGFDLSNYFKGLESVCKLVICNAEYLTNLDFMNDIGYCEKLILDTKKELQLLQIDGLKKHSSLKHLEIPTAKKLKDVSILKELKDLQYLDLSTCIGLTVKPRPVLMKTKEEVSAYQIKL